MSLCKEEYCKGHCIVREWLSSRPLPYPSQVEIKPENSVHKKPKAIGKKNDMDEVHKKRIGRVEAVCEKYKSLRSGYSPTSTQGSFTFDMKNGLAWCKNDKVIRSLDHSEYW